MATAPRGLRTKQRDPPGQHQRGNIVVFIPEAEKQGTTMLCSQDHALKLFIERAEDRDSEAPKPCVFYLPTPV